MKLTNFELEGPIQTITIRAFELEWDLHNFADFVGFRFDSSAKSLLLEWLVPRMQQNPWGSAENSARGCRLRFINVSSLEGRWTAESIPKDLSGISRVVPGNSEYRFKKEWNGEEEFHLLFEFEGGAEIEIDADMVTFETIQDAEFRPHKVSSSEVME